MQLAVRRRRDFRIGERLWFCFQVVTEMDVDALTVLILPVSARWTKQLGDLRIARRPGSQYGTGTLYVVSENR